MRADFADFADQQRVGNLSLDSVEDGWGSFTARRSPTGFDLLGQIITAAGGGHVHQGRRRARPPTTRSTTRRRRATTLSRRLGAPAGRSSTCIDGKYVDTTWDFNGCGYYWADECQTRIGYFVDKTVALDVLSQSQAYFTGRDTSTDVRKYAIGYILPFKTQIEEKFGALLAGDYTSFAPQLRPTAGKTTTVQPELGARPRTGGAVRRRPSIIDPAGGFTLQLYAGVYGLSTFPTTFDHSFIDTTQDLRGRQRRGAGAGRESSSTTADEQPAQMVRHGDADELGGICVTDSDDAQRLSTVDAGRRTRRSLPVNGRLRHRRPTASTRARACCETVQTLSWQQAERRVRAPTGTPAGGCAAKTPGSRRSSRENIDVMRSLHNAFGYAAYKTDAPFFY